MYLPKYKSIGDNFLDCEYIEKLEQSSKRDYLGIKQHLTDVKINLESRCISRKQCFTYTLLLFILAGIFEIGGGYFIWLWLREGEGLAFAFLGAIVLFLYGIVPTFQPADFHRIYATYGGIFVVMSILWGWVFDKIQPDTYDLIGAVIILIGVSIIYYWPREDEIND
jgi:small multidrug resistance family-3 protein